MDAPHHEEITQYIENSREILEAARLMFENDFYTSAVNRAYYAIFYAANALLVTEGISQSKHAGVISAFRQYFVKTGEIAPEYSKIYGRVMEDRHESVYELGSPITPDEAQENIDRAENFVDEVEKCLKRKNWL